MEDKRGVEMNTVYTNISPVTNAYTNFNHFFYLKNVLNAKKVYVCVWDSFVYEDPRFYQGLGSKTDKFQKLSENVALIEKLMKHIGLSYKIIYLSEAWERLFKKTQYSQIFQKVMSRLTIEDLKKGFLIPYIPYNDISLSKLNYIVADYLIAVHLHDLFPEISDRNPKYYLSSERFKVFNDCISTVLKAHYGSVSLPELVLVKNVPVILDSRGFIPSIEMPLHELKRVFSEHYSKKEPDDKEIDDFLNVLQPVLNDNFVLGQQRLPVSKLFKHINTDDKHKLCEILAENLHEYFSKLQDALSTKEADKPSKAKYITDEKDFGQLLKTLNPLKIRILQECNGLNSSFDIAKKAGLNKNTVSPYLTQLRNLGFITNDRRPRRLINSLVIDLEGIEINNGGAG